MITLIRMINVFWLNETSNQIENEKFTSLFKVANGFLVKWNIIC
jgi:hypothetical protein